MKRRGFFGWLGSIVVTLCGLPWLLTRCGSNPFTYGLRTTTVDDHDHVLQVPCADIDSPTSAGVSTTTSRVAAHEHTVTFTEAELLQVKGGEEVTVTTSSVQGHTHEVTLPRSC